MSFDVTSVKIIILYVLIVTSFIYCKVKDPNLKQEHVRIIFKNPKYIGNFTVITTSNGGKDRSYVTSVLCNILHPWGNNVTTYFKYTIGRTKNDFEVSLPLCKGLSEKWLTDYLARFTSQNLNKCPISADLYNLSNIEVPPKNFPFPLPRGIYHLQTGFFNTQTKEKILDVSAKDEHIIMTAESETVLFIVNYTDLYQIEC